MYEPYWLLLIAGLKIFLSRMQDDPLFTKQILLPKLKDLFDRRRENDAIYAWALIDQENETGQSLLQNLLENGIIPQIPGLPMNIYRDFLTDLSFSREILMKVEAVTDFSLHGKDLLTDGEVILYWPHASRHFTEQDHFYLRSLKTPQMYRALAITPPRFITAKEAKITLEACPDFKDPAVINFANIRGWTPLVKVLSLKLYLVCEELGFGLDETGTPPFVKQETDHATLKEASDASHGKERMRVSLEPLLSETLIGEFIISLKDQDNGLSPITYINVLSQFMAYIGADPQAKRLPLTPGIMDEYFTYLATEGLIFSREDLREQAEILTEFMAYMRSRDELYQAYYQEIRKVLEELFFYVHKINDKRGFVVKEDLLHLVKDVDAPFLDDFHYIFFYLLNESVELTKVKKNLKGKDLAKIHASLPNSIIKEPSRASTQSNYPYISEIFNYILNKGYFIVDDTSLVLSDIGVRFIQLPEAHQLAIIMHHWTNPEYLKGLCPNEEVFHRFFNKLKQQVQSQNQNQDYITEDLSEQTLLYIFHNLCLVDISSVDPYFKVQLTPLAFKIYDVLFPKDTLPENIIYLNHYRS